MPPAPAGLQPFEWGAICVLFLALLTLVLYIWKDSRARDEKDRLAIEASVTALNATLTETIKNFSARVDKSIEDIRLNARELSSSLQKLGERMAVLESKRDDARDEQYQVRGELSKLNAELSKLSMTVARIAGQMGITTSTSTAYAAVPAPRPERRDKDR